MLHSSLFTDTVQFSAGQRLLVLNSAADPFLAPAAHRLGVEALTLAEDNLAALKQACAALFAEPRHLPFHEYTAREPEGMQDVALLSLLYQPGNAWMYHALRVAGYALKPGGTLYVQGAKDRGVLSLARHMEAFFGNVETLEISKGQRVIAARRQETLHAEALPGGESLEEVFAGGKLDEGTRLLLEALEVRVTDVALDLGCGAGYLGLEIARRAPKGRVTLVDVSLLALDLAWRQAHEGGLTNVEVLASDGTEALSGRRFDLVATNPPFHLGGVQTKQVAERFIREAARALQPRGRFYVVANRFLKYEPALKAAFQEVEEVGGDRRYKVLRAQAPLSARGRDETGMPDFLV